MLRDDRSKGTSLRVSMLQSDRRLALEEGDTARAAMLGRIIKAEALHSSFEKLQRAMNRGKSASIDTVQVLQADGTIQSTSSAVDMIPLIIDHNRVHFSQAEGTPFTIGSLQSIEHTACCQRAESILAGEFESPDITTVHASFIKHLAIPPTQDCTLYVNCALSIDDVKSGYAAWREKTSTSPHGDHLGIYKVLLKDLSDITCGRHNSH